MKDKNQPLFIRYASHPTIKEDPDSFFRLAELIDEDGYLVKPGSIHHSEALFSPRAIITDVLTKAQRLNEGSLCGLHQSEIDFIRETEECDSQCGLFFPGRRALFPEEARGGTLGLKCFECEQQYFICALEKVVSGENIEEIPGFFDYYNTWKQWFLFKDERGNFFWRSPFAIEMAGWKGGPDHEKPQRYIFNEFIRGFVSHSLFRYLEENGTRRLKKCVLCGSFFIAKDAKRTMCYSTECQKLYGRQKKKMQRDRNPKKYC